MKKMQGKILYKEDLKTDYVNGAFGSISQSGEFVINFFFEQPDNSNQFIIEVDDNNVPNQIFEDNGVLKNVVSKIVLNVNTAKSIAKWINDNIEAFEKNGEGNDLK